jgi:hypothetical protein
MECKNDLKRCLEKSINSNKVCYLSNKRALLAHNCADFENIRVSDNLEIKKRKFF